MSSRATTSGSSSPSSVSARRLRRTDWRFQLVADVGDEVPPDSVQTVAVRGVLHDGDRPMRLDRAGQRKGPYYQLARRRREQLQGLLGGLAQQRPRQCVTDRLFGEHLVRCTAEMALRDGVAKYRGPISIADHHAVLYQVERSAQAARHDGIRAGRRSPLGGGGRDAVPLPCESGMSATPGHHELDMNNP